MKSEEISAFLSERIAAGDFPSAVYLVGEKGEIIFQDALGLSVKTNDLEIAAELDTIYDLASLTKPLVTGLLCAKLIETGEIELDDKIAEFLPEFEQARKREITVQNLLAHTSGFPAWFPFYLSPKSEVQSPKSSCLATITETDLESLPNALVRYSDFNFLTLGFLLEKLRGDFLREIARREIFEPLDLTNTFFNPPNALQNKIAACEFGNEYEKQIFEAMNFEIRNSQSAIRNRLIWGEVHDANCYFLGGASGHAGLFSTAAEVFKIAGQFLPDTTVLLKPETCELFKTNFTINLNEARSFAFELAATKDSTASEALAKNSFGHLGFTGTSLWIEPDAERIFILLTNRTHRPLPFVNINSTRREFHRLAVQLLHER